MFERMCMGAHFINLSYAKHDVRNLTMKLLVKVWKILLMKINILSKKSCTTVPIYL